MYARHNIADRGRRAQGLSFKSCRVGQRWCGSFVCQMQHGWKGLGACLLTLVASGETSLLHSKAGRETKTRQRSMPTPAGIGSHSSQGRKTRHRRVRMADRGEGSSGRVLTEQNRSTMYCSIPHVIHNMGSTANVEETGTSKGSGSYRNGSYVARKKSHPPTMCQDQASMAGRCTTATNKSGRQQCRFVLMEVVHLPAIDACSRQHPTVHTQQCLRGS